MKTLSFADREMPVIGAGLWGIGEGIDAHAQRRALDAAFDAGLVLLDTAEMYGNGASERVAGAAARSARAQGKDVFVVSKVLPSNARPQLMRTALTRSLHNLGLDYLDMYLLHWRSTADLAFVAQQMHEFVQGGLIRHWGVSNFDVADMQELLAVPYGEECACDQNLYNLANRGMDYDLMPWLRDHHIPLMAYSPLGDGGPAGTRVMVNNTEVKKVAARHHASAQQVMLAWCVRDGNTLAIPQSANPEHLVQDFHSGSLELDEHDFAALDSAFPAPTSKQRLAKL